jgi:hypothetical protein
LKVHFFIIRIIRFSFAIKIIFVKLAFHIKGESSKHIKILACYFFQRGCSLIWSGRLAPVFGALIQDDRGNQLMGVQIAPTPFS